MAQQIKVIKRQLNHYKISHIICLNKWTILPIKITPKFTRHQILVKTHQAHKHKGIVNLITLYRGMTWWTMLETSKHHHSIFLHGVVRMLESRYNIWSMKRTERAKTVEEMWLSNTESHSPRFQIHTVPIQIRMIMTKNSIHLGRISTQGQKMAMRVIKTAVNSWSSKFHIIVEKGFISMGRRIALRKMRVEYLYCRRRTLGSLWNKNRQFQERARGVNQMKEQEVSQKRHRQRR